MALAHTIYKLLSDSFTTCARMPCKLVRLSPLQEHQFEAEAGTHRRQNAVTAGRTAMAVERVGQHHQHRRSRKIADLAQALPGQGEREVGNLERGQIGTAHV